MNKLEYFTILTMTVVAEAKMQVKMTLMARTLLVALMALVGQDPWVQVPLRIREAEADSEPTKRVLLLVRVWQVRAHAF